MSRPHLLLIIILSTSTASYAQFGKKFKNLGKNLMDAAQDLDLADNKSNQFEELRKKQLAKDTSYYNFALAQAEKVSFFNSRDDNQGIMLSIAKNYEDENIQKPELLPYEEVFDLNRAGSNVLLVNRRLALWNFTEALTYYLEDDALSYFLFTPSDEVGNIEDLIPKITKDTSQLPDGYAITKTFANLAIFYHSIGHYTFANQLNRSLITYARNTLGGGSIALASVYNNLALIERDLGNYTETEELLKKSEKILQSRKSDSKLDLAVLYNNLAMMYQEIGQYQKAIDQINKALELASGEIRKKGADYSKIQLNKALVLKAQRKYPEAEKILRDLKISKERRLGKRHQDYADIESILAALYMEQGKTENVESLLTHALDIYESKFSNHHPAYTSTLRTLAQYYFLTDNFTKSLQTNEQVKNLIENYFGTQHPDYLKVVEDIAVGQWNLGQIDKSAISFAEVNNLLLNQIDKFFPAMSENEKSKFWSKARPSLMKFFSFVAENHESRPALLSDMYDLHLATKGILLSSTSKVRQVILSSDDESLKSSYIQWTRVKEELATYYTLSKQEIKEQKINLDSLEAVSNNLEKELTRSSNLFAQSTSTRAPKSSDISKSLQQDEVAIEIVRIPKFKRVFETKISYLALVLDSDNKIKAALLENGLEMESKYASAYRKSIQFKLGDQISYQNYWEPIHKLITGKKKLYLSLDGIYNQINVNTLRLPGGSFLSDETLTITVSSTRDIKDIAEQSVPQKEVLMFGFPDYGGSGKVVSLPGTKIELEKIGSIVKQKGLAVHQYMAKEANEKQFKTKADNPEVLHIATHGFFLDDLPESDEVVFGVEIEKARENPLLRSGLMLADAEKTINQLVSREVSSADNGILTAYEAMTLNLDQTKLVILSACETGLGEIKSGEGVYGLQRAFQIAGAETIVMSLWKVDDAATQKLMTYFYTEWLNNGNKLTAFQKAQNKLRQEYKDPYYWGAFVMMN
ncbi:MAG: CHAT domain-containing protein [Cyclobacteriaceae bacterium]|nr:CHAT domain-containing protein [Cyclobacteriaceae bacterium HetDA_MAG_MS6]